MIHTHFFAIGSNMLIEVDTKGFFPLKFFDHLSSDHILLALTPGQGPYENNNLDRVNVFKLPTTQLISWVRLIIM